MSNVKRAGALYSKFYQFEPRDVKRGSFDMPKRAVCVGQMKIIYYASDKWERKVNYYQHHHDDGVKLYEPASSGGLVVPKRICGVEALTKLGRCPGLKAVIDGEEREVALTGCDLYAIPSGRALVIVRGTSKVEFLIWGGKLNVEDRGIVH